MAMLHYTPKTLYKQPFHTVLRGYKPQEVDSLLDFVIKDYQTFGRIIKKLRTSNDDLTYDIKPLRYSNNQLNQQVADLKNKISSQHLSIVGSNNVTTHTKKTLEKSRNKVVQQFDEINDLHQQIKKLKQSNVKLIKQRNSLKNKHKQTTHKLHHQKGARPDNNQVFTASSVNNYSFSPINNKHEFMPLHSNHHQYQAKKAYNAHKPGVYPVNSLADVQRLDLKYAHENPNSPKIIKMIDRRLTNLEKATHLKNPVE